MKPHTLELIRYGINGVVATVVHYAVLTFNLRILHFSSAGLANLLAAVAGIATSFLGSRYFVFASTGRSVSQEAVKFFGLYAAIAALHGLLLFAWTDWYGLDYRAGFCLATVIQVSLSYVGNKYLVFNS